MKYYDKLLQLKKIRSALADKESITIFDARIDYMIDRDIDKFHASIRGEGKKWVCKELEDALGKYKFEGIVVFGCGHDGKWTKKILEDCNHILHAFCDSDKSKVGAMVDGVPVISIDDLVGNFKNCLVIIGSGKHGKEMYDILLDRKFPQDRILFPKYRILSAECGKQYFDLFAPTENETFIDGGAFDGDTIFDFLVWSKGNYNKIFAFEPIQNMKRNIKKRVDERKVDNVLLYTKALWNKEDILHFSNAGSASCILENGSEIIEGINLDKIVGNEKITFLKLDVEGSELEALEGAKNIIVRDKPKLAVCIYHKPEDVFMLPAYVLELVPEYKLYIRQYWSTPAETVLYAHI